MKKYLLFTFVSFFSYAASLNCDEAQTQDQNKEATPQLHNETDKTDIYAIPLDLSEQEENQEIKRLDSYGQKK